MKRLTIPIFIVAIIMMLSLAQAVVTQKNNFFEGVIENNNELSHSSKIITNVNAAGFICSNADCSQTSGRLFNGDILNSQSTSSITLTYPTELIDNGYGVFFYKQGYIPYEVKSDWHGNGTASEATRYLAKKRVCVSPIDSLNASVVNNEIIVNAQVSSPILNSGPLNLAPDFMSSHYSTSVDVEFNFKNNSANNVIKSVSIPFSGKGSVSTTLPLEAGTENITVRTSTQDPKCISYEPRQASILLIVENDLPPAPVRNLHVLNKTENSISWGWINPSDVDFSQAIIYVDGINTVNTTANAIKISNLLPNTEHTITINTKDVAGNINTQNVSDTERTLPAQNGTKDTTPPAAVTNLRVINVTSNSIAWAWDNPTDPDFAHVHIIINGVQLLETAASNYTNTTLLPDTLYTLTLTTEDTSKNINTTPVSSTQRTLPATNNTKDTTPPATVTNLHVVSRTSNSITWAWDNPTDPDFAHVHIILNGVQLLETAAETYTNNTRSPDTVYTLTLTTEDTSKNINTTPVSNRQRTLPLSSDDDDDDDDGDSNDRERIVLSSGDETPSRPIYYDLSNELGSSDREYLQDNARRRTISFGWIPVIGLGILCLLLILLILLVLASRGSSNGSRSKSMPTQNKGPPYKPLR